MIKKTKKLFALLLVLVLAFAFALTGCKKKDEGDDDSPSSGTTATTALATSVGNLLDSTALYGEGSMAVVESGYTRTGAASYDKNGNYVESYGDWEKYSYNQDFELKGGFVADTKNYKVKELNFDLLAYGKDEVDYRANNSAIFARDGKVYRYNNHGFISQQIESLDDFKKKLVEISKNGDILVYGGDLDDINKNLGNEVSVELDGFQDLILTAGNLRKGLLKGLATFVSVEKKGTKYTIDVKKTITDFLDKLVKAVEVVKNDPSITFERYYNKNEVKAILDPITKNVKAADVISYADSYIATMNKIKPTGYADLKSLLKGTYNLSIPDAKNMNLDAYIKELFKVKVSFDGGEIALGDMGVSNIIANPADAFKEISDTKKEIEKTLIKWEIVLTISANKIKDVKVDIEVYEEGVGNNQYRKDERTKITGQFTFTTSTPTLLSIDEAVKKADKAMEVPSPSEIKSRLESQGYVVSICESYGANKAASVFASSAGVTLNGQAEYCINASKDSDSITIIWFTDKSDAIAMKNAGYRITGDTKQTGASGNVFYVGTYSAKSATGFKF